jgi:cell division septation protein DedD
VFHRALVKAVLVVVAIATLSGLVLQRPAHAASNPAQAFLDKINALRASKGVAPLQMNAAVTTFAAGWTQHMVSTDTLAHNPNLASAPNDWTVVGENVGDGVSVDAIFDGFSNSAHHYANMVDPRFNIVGISVMTDSGGRLWTTHDFEQVAASAPVAAPKPAPAPKPAAAPAPRPAAPVVAPPAPAPAPAPVAAAPAPAPAPVAPAAVPASIKYALEQLRGTDPNI